MVDAASDRPVKLKDERLFPCDDRQLTKTGERGDDFAGGQGSAQIALSESMPMVSKGNTA